MQLLQDVRARSGLVWCGALGLGLALVSPVAGDNVIVDLGTLGGPASQASGINNAGQVTGFAHNTEDEPQEAIIWEGGTLTGLSQFGGPASSGTAINGDGVIAGFFQDALYQNQAYIWDSVNGMTPLGTLPGRLQSVALGINDLNEVVGVSHSGIGPTASAFLWDSVNGMIDLGVMDGFQASFALDINNASQVVGYNDGPSGDLAYIWDSVNGMVGIGTLGGMTSRANAINDAGTVVGESDNGTFNEAFIYTDADGMTGLGSLDGASDSEANAINSAGWVVGTSGDEAFIWAEGFGMVSLFSLLEPGHEWDALLAATGINDNNDVVGYGIIDGALHGFVIENVQIPAPSTLALLGCAASVGCRRRRRGQPSA